MAKAIAPRTPPRDRSAPERLPRRERDRPHAVLDASITASSCRRRRDMVTICTIRITEMSDQGCRSAPARRGGRTKPSGGRRAPASHHADEPQRRTATTGTGAGSSASGSGCRITNSISAPRPANGPGSWLSPPRPAVGTDSRAAGRGEGVDRGHQVAHHRVWQSLAHHPAWHGDGGTRPRRPPRTPPAHSRNGPPAASGMDSPPVWAAAVSSACRRAALGPRRIAPTTMTR